MWGVRRGAALPRLENGFCGETRWCRTLESDDHDPRQTPALALFLGGCERDSGVFERSAAPAERGWRRRGPGHERQQR